MWMVKGSPAESSYEEVVKHIADEGGRYAKLLLSGGLDDWALRQRIGVADAFDEIVDGNDKFIEPLLRNERAYAVKVWNKGDLTDRLEGSLIFGTVYSQMLLYRGLSAIAQGTVDILRLGQGTLHERSAGGVAKDALRLLAVLPLGRIAGVVKASRISGLARVVVQDALSMECTSNSAIRALWMTRFKFFAKITDLWEAAEIGIPAGHPGVNGVFIAQIIPVMEEVGARVSFTAIQRGSTLVDIARLAKAHPNDVVMFSVELAKSAGKEHTLLASALEGRIKFYDTTNQVFHGLEELENVYRGFTPYEAAIVHEARAITAARFAGRIHGQTILAQLVLPVVNRPTTPLVIDRSTSIVRQRRRTAGPSTIDLELRNRTVSVPLGDGGWMEKKEDFWTYRVQPGDSLNLIATKVYRDAKMVPRIAEANRRLVGPAPSYMIHPGQELVLPDK